MKIQIINIYKCRNIKTTGLLNFNIYFESLKDIEITKIFLIHSMIFIQFQYFIINSKYTFMRSNKLKIYFRNTNLQRLNNWLFSRTHWSQLQFLMFYLFFKESRRKKSYEQRGGRVKIIFSNPITPTPLLKQKLSHAGRARVMNPKKGP